MLIPDVPTLVIQFKTGMHVTHLMVSHYLLGWFGQSGPVWGLQCRSCPAGDGDHVRLWTLTIKTYHASIGEVFWNAVLRYNYVLHNSVGMCFTDNAAGIAAGSVPLTPNDWTKLLCDHNAARAEAIDDARLESESALASVRAELEELRNAYAKLQRENAPKMPARPRY